MNRFTAHVIDAYAGKHPVTKVRDPRWGKKRAEHLLIEPTCRVCGGTEELTVHHVKPFHLYPEYELKDWNLITLCESKKAWGFNCHLVIGHLGNFKNWNAWVRQDSRVWLKRLTA